MGFSLQWFRGLEENLSVMISTSASAWKFLGVTTGSAATLVG
jgi:hypothetical protein